MDCRKFEEECLMSGGNLSREARNHLACCEKCRTYAQAAALTLFQTQAVQAEKIQCECKKILAERASASKCAWKCMAKWVSCAAAVAVIMVGISFSIEGGRSNHEQGGILEERTESDVDLEENYWGTDVSELQNDLSELEVSVSFLACGI